MAFWTYFDSNIHPSLPEKEFEVNGYLSSLEKQVRSVGAHQALAVNLPSMNRHLSQREYVESFGSHPFFVPVPTLMSFQDQDVLDLIALCRSLQYPLAKIHPRLIGISFLDSEFRELLEAFSSNQIAVLLCTYPYGFSGGGMSHLPSLLDAVLPSELRVILMHAGATQLLDLAEWARSKSDQVLLDLSWTIHELRLSSVWLDVLSLLDRFDRRLVLGTDFPEITLAEMHSVLGNLHYQHPSVERLRGPLHENLESFLGSIAKR